VQDADSVDPADSTAPSEGEGADGGPEEPKTTRVPLPLVGVIAGLMVAAGVVAVLAMTGFFRSEPVRASAEESLVTSYGRSRQVSYTLEGKFTRTKPDGAQLESGALVVQRPPDALRRQLGAISGRMNGRKINCSTDQAGGFVCAPGREVANWDEMVEKEIANLRSYFEGSRPVYRATRLDNGCFELTLLVDMADPPYGVRAVMCFDPVSNAMRSIEIEHEGGVIDRLEASAIRPVADEDFALEENDAFAAHTGGG
jgi:hypothetical protein